MSVEMANKVRRSQTAATEEAVIRDAAEADLPAIIDIYNAAIVTRLSTAQLQTVTLESRRDWLDEFSSDRRPFWVIESHGTVAGWLTIKDFLPRGAYAGTVELSVYVHEKFRRHGFATKLLERALERGPELGIHAMVGLIFTHNEPSLRLFERLGFERWGLLPRVAQLDERKRDLALMGRHIPDR